MTKRILAAVLLLCLFVSVVYAQSAATVFGWPPADGSVTNAKLAEPVSVANGGTGATTAAAGLAALGGASLNGSSTVAFHASIYNTAAGTAAAPTYSFSSDPDTGIYSPAADTIGFGEGGAESMRITSGGNVLIGTSTDDGTNKLQVNGSVKIAGNLTSINGGTFNTYVFDLAVGGSASLYGVFSSTYGILEVVDMGGLNSGGKWFVKAGADTSTLLSDYGNAASTDTAGKICVYSAGASVYYIKNNLAAPASFHAVFHGLKQ